jgi:hypothetical protein
MLSSIVNKFSSRKKPIILGEIFVNGQSQFTKFLEFQSNDESAPERLKEWVRDLLEIPVLSQDQCVEDDSLILDVAVRKYRFGTDLALYSEPLMPLFWRPRINLDLRIREYKTNKTLGECSVKNSMGWGEYIRRVFSLKSMFGLGSSFDSNDLRRLLAKSLLDGLVWAKRQVKS